MASPRSRPRRLLLPILLAAVLAAEITGLAIARQAVPIGPADGSIGTTAIHPSAASANRPGNDLGRVVGAADLDRSDRARDPQAVVPPSAGLPNIAGSRPSSPASPAGSARTTPTAAPTATRAAPTYRGRNHLWIPSLGINRPVSSFPCSRTRPPDNLVYRWGCAGRNNVYLLGHAYSVFKPLHDAYVGGRLRKGLKVVYADGSGKVHTYSVIWWKVVAPTTAASWAWAAQSRPSMTLQTCVGANSRYRLMVRLVRVG
jgi:hypothetical protein